MAALAGDFLAEVAQPMAAVLTNRFEHRVARWSPVRVPLDDGLLDQRSQVHRDVGGGQIAP